MTVFLTAPSRPTQPTPPHLNRPLTYSLSYAALDLNRDLHLSCRAFGIGASLFFASYAMLQV